MTYQTNHLATALAAIVATVMMVACSTFTDETNPYAVEEAMKDMSGTWRLKTVTRNGINITQQMDFSRFRLILDADGTYTIQNYLPFVVKENGTWKVNDPLHPMLLSFKENGEAEGIDLDFTYPVVDGSRALSITLSPGCHTNSYVYSFYRDKAE